MKQTNKQKAALSLKYWNALMVLYLNINESSKTEGWLSYSEILCYLEFAFGKC